MAKAASRSCHPMADFLVARIPPRRFSNITSFGEPFHGTFCTLPARLTIKDEPTVVIFSTFSAEITVLGGQA